MISNSGTADSWGCRIHGRILANISHVDQCTAVRTKKGLTSTEIQHCLLFWTILCWKPYYSEPYYAEIQCKKLHKAGTQKDRFCLEVIGSLRIHLHGANWYLQIGFVFQLCCLSQVRCKWSDRTELCTMSRNHCWHHHNKSCYWGIKSLSMNT